MLGIGPHSSNNQKYVLWNVVSAKEASPLWPTVSLLKAHVWNSLFYFRSEIWQSERSRWPTCVTMPNSVAISQTVTEIWWFSIFCVGGHCHLEFLKFEIFFTVGCIKRVELHHSAKFCGDRSNRCRDMTINMNRNRPLTKPAIERVKACTR